VLMLDAGRLMGARAALPAEDEAAQLVEGEVASGLAKIDYVVNAALLLAYVAGLRGDRVSLLAYADEVRTFLPPTRGRRAFLRVVDALYALQPEPVEPDHGLALQFLAARNLRRSLVVLFTDLADRESSTSLVANLLRAGRHHLVVCVTLGDPTVSRPALAAPESTQGLYEKMVAQRLLDERAAVLATLAQRGVHTLDTDADRLSPGLIDAYLEIKQRGRI
ncbi:MAG TPA: VWA domain-containing protein, partial [Chloroflexota bacterium]|nr:VWA domain-containing protein [Chloroflexota bacterium]